MKKLLMLIVMVVMGFLAMAQTPQISYQAVVRDNNNRLVTNKAVDVKVEVLNGSDVKYTQGPASVTTNANGLFSMLIGDGTLAFDTLHWENATIRTTVTVDGTDLVNTVPVTAAPLALKSLTSASVDPESAVIQAIYAKIKADSTTLQGNIDTVSVAVRGALVDSVAALRTDLATKAALADSTAAVRGALADTAAAIRGALADTAAAIRDDMADGFVTKVKFSADSTVFADDIKTNADNIDTILIKYIPQLTDSIRENKQAIIDTAQSIRDEIAALDTVYAKLTKVKADSTVLHGALIDTATAIRTDMDKKIKDGKLIIYMGTDSLDMFTANDSLEHRVDVLHKFTHQEMLDTVLNFIDASVEAEALNILGALKTKQNGNPHPIWTPIRDSIAGIVMDYVMEEMMKDTTQMTLLDRTIERIKQIAPTLGHDDAKYYLNKAKEIKDLVPADVKEDILVEIKYRAKELLKSTKFQNQINSILSDAEVKNAIVNNSGLQGLVTSYLQTNGASAMNAILSAPGSQAALNTQVESYLENHGGDALNALLSSPAGKAALNSHINTYINSSEGQAVLTAYLSTPAGKAALSNFLSSDTGKTVLSNYLTGEDGKCAIYKVLNSINPTEFPSSGAPTGCTIP